jgi:hypothetical protein
LPTKAAASGYGLQDGFDLSFGANKKLVIEEYPGSELTREATIDAA